jgi:PIN domain nuclease of toxin-antitoxin system
VTYLLDTHVWLWLLAEPERIGEGLLVELRDRRTRLLLSAASAQSERIAIVTADPMFERCDVPLRLVGPQARRDPTVRARSSR